MFPANAFALFEEYLDPESFLDKDGEMVDLKNRFLIPDAPKSAIDAFNDYKEQMRDAEKRGIKL